MCTVSFVSDEWVNRQPLQWITYSHDCEVSRAEFDSLKKEVEALKKLLIAAKIYDAETGQPDCEDAEKVALIKRLADLVGVDLEDVFPE